MTDQEASTKKQARRLIPVIIGVVLMVVCLVFIVRVLSHDWANVSDSLEHASWFWLGGGLVCASVGMVIIAATWADALKIVGGTMPRGRSIAWYFVGEIGKYLPGAIWAAVGRGEIARRRGIRVTQAYPSVMLSLIGLYLAAAFGAALLLPFDLAHSADMGPALFLLLLVPIGLGLLHPNVVGTALGVVERLTNRTTGITVPRWGETVTLILRYLPAWVGICAATWCVARALPGVDAPVIRISLATVLSWTAGFVTPTPGGAGVREAVFIGASGIGAGPAVAVAVTARILFVVVDVVGAMCGLPFTRRQAEVPVSVDSWDSLAVPVEEKG